MSKFIFRASIETETAKQDKVSSLNCLEVLADHILAMTDKERHGPRLSCVSSSFRRSDLLRKRS
jgi:hypothetical protein